MILLFLVSVKIHNYEIFLMTEIDLMFSYCILFCLYSILPILPGDSKILQWMYETTYGTKLHTLTQTCTNTHYFLAQCATAN